MQISLTPAIVDLAARADRFGAQIDTAQQHTNDIASRITRLGRGKDGVDVLPADDARIVTLRRDMADVADALDSAISKSGLPTTFRDVAPYEGIAGKVRATVRRMERAAEVNIDGLARSFGRATSTVGLDNAESFAESVAGAVRMLRTPDGSLRQVDADGIESMAGELDAFRTRWSSVEDALADAYRGTQQLVDERSAGDYRDDVLYTADLVETVRPALEAIAGSMRSAVNDSLVATRGQSAASGLTDALIGEATLLVRTIDDAAVAGTHAVDANEFLFELERLRGDSREFAPTSPSRAAAGEAWNLRTAAEHAQQLPPA